MADDDSSGKTFTQADVDKAFAAGAQRARQAAAEKYADYDDLKARATEADKSKTEIEKLTASVQALTDRAVKSEAAAARASVAEELGLTSKQARRLSGSTREELLADGREMMEDLGLKPKSTNGKTTALAGKGGDGQDVDDDDLDEDEDDEPQQQAPRRRERPREDLRSGAPVTRREKESSNPMDLIKNIPR